MFRKKIGLTKRKHKWNELKGEGIAKFLFKRYMLFWTITIIMLIFFFMLMDSAMELWLLVPIIYIGFALVYSVVVLLQNLEIRDIAKRIDLIADGEMAIDECDENSFCVQSHKNLNRIVAIINELETDKHELLEKAECYEKALEELNSRIDKICDGDYSEFACEDGMILAQSHQKLNELGKAVAKTIEIKTKAERTKVELVTNVSHDLKTPLTSIIGYIDLLSKIEDMPQEAQDYVGIISRKAECLSHTVYDLFDIAKASAMQDIELEEIDGVMLLRQVLADMQDNFENCDTPIRESYTDNACKIISNGKKLYRVFQNLLDNALKYSLSGSRIYISQYCDEKNFVVEIHNTANYEMTFDANEISERFVRGDKSRTDEESNGLGLSIVSSFTQACGGSFAVAIDCDRFIATVKFPKIS